MRAALRQAAVPARQPLHDYLCLWSSRLEPLALAMPQTLAKENQSPADDFAKAYSGLDDARSRARPWIAATPPSVSGQCGRWRLQVFELALRKGCKPSNPQSGIAVRFRASPAGARQTGGRKPIAWQAALSFDGREREGKKWISS